MTAEVTTMEATAPPTVSESPKHAFRAAEWSLRDVDFRPPVAGIERACDRLRAALGDLGIDVRAALYQSDRIESRRVAGSADFPDWIADADLAPVSAEPASYAPPDSPARAAWRIGPRREWTIVWRFAPAVPSAALILLEAFRVVLGERLLEASFSSILEQAAAIQRDLLPDPLPALPGFDLAARSVPAEAVGGDVYDAIPLSPDALAFAIADVSGHGLPAALEARDVVVGLRMGAARHMKIDATVEKLNRILCRNALSSRFVSLVYGELDTDGRFQFVNAGHPHPILVDANGVRALSDTGLVLGVSGNVRHRVQYGAIPPGGMLALVTDGILEARSAAGREFGAAGVASLVTALREKPAAWIVSALFEALIDHTGDLTPADDATALVIKREG